MPLEPWFLSQYRICCHNQEETNSSKHRKTAAFAAQPADKPTFFREGGFSNTREAGRRAGGKDRGNLLHVLYSSGEETLLRDFGNAAHAAIAKPVQFFGIGKTSFNGFSSSAVNVLSVIGVREVPCSVLEILPYMPTNRFGGLFCTETQLPSLASCTSILAALVFPIVQCTPRSIHPL